MQYSSRKFILSNVATDLETYNCRMSDLGYHQLVLQGAADPGKLLQVGTIMTQDHMAFVVLITPKIFGSAAAGLAIWQQGIGSEHNQRPQGRQKPAHNALTALPPC